MKPMRTCHPMLPSPGPSQKPVDSVEFYFLFYAQAYRLAPFSLSADRSRCLLESMGASFCRWARFACGNPAKAWRSTQPTTEPINTRTMPAYPIILACSRKTKETMHNIPAKLRQQGHKPFLFVVPCESERR